VGKIPVAFFQLIPDCQPINKTQGGRTMFVIEKPFEFWIDGYKHVIPVGYKFDGASVPRGMWNTFPPFHPLHIVPALIHDWLYGSELYPRKLADDVFLSALKRNGVALWRRSAMYAAVHWFGWATYNKHSLASVMQIRGLSGITAQRRPLYDDVREIVLPQ
jgi:hypothetical protein